MIKTAGDNDVNKALLHIAELLRSQHEELEDLVKTTPLDPSLTVLLGRYMDWNRRARTALEVRLGI